MTNPIEKEIDKEIKIKVVAASGVELPAYATPGSSGMDIRARLDSPVTLAPGERALIPTGLRVQLPRGHELQVRPRSGLALKHGITVLNSPGTVDSDYRGEIGVILINLGGESFVINNGDRIAQIVVARYTRVCWDQVKLIDETERGDGGFGHSGTE